MQQNTDSINWPPEFSELKRLDVILKCGICYDFMNNCMMTSCAHTYCSLCIRKFMQYKNQCPTCYEETYEINLRNNRLLDEVIHIYTKIRDKLLRASRLASINVTKYESKEAKSETKELPSNSTGTKPSHIPEVGVDIQNSTKNAEGETTNSEHIKLLKLPVGNDDSIIVNGVKVPGMFTSPKISSTRPKRPEELTACPVCEVKVPARNINIHLDSCLALDPAIKPKPRVKKRSPLPKRVYTMMPEKNLKKFLKEYGLSTTGDRKTLIARLQRFTVIYNAENDAVNPRPVSELIKQLEKEEREEKKPNSIMKNLHTTAPRPAVPKNDVGAIEKANKAYCDENKASFKKLIEEMRAREGRNIKPLKPINRIYSDDEDDPNKVDSTNSDYLPSTSGQASSKELNSSGDTVDHKNSRDPLHNLVNTNYEESEDDIIMNSDTEDRVVIGKIDWNKTLLTCEEGTPDSVYEMATQNPLPNIDLTSDDEDLKKKNIDNTTEKSCDSLSTDYDDSDGSVFNTSVIRKPNNSTTKKKNSKPRKTTKKGRRLSLAWKTNKKDSQKNDNGESIEDSLSGNDIEDDVNNDNLEHTTGKIVDCDDLLEEDNNDKDDGEYTECYDKINCYDDTDEINENCNNGTDEINENAEPKVLNDKGIQESPKQPDDIEKPLEVKTPVCVRLTRSAKRKSMSNQEMKGEEHSTTPTSTKKTKRDMSPEV